jgi:sugar phosphate isomerase/epimerase
MKIEKGLAVQSWCFREMKTHDEVIKALKDSGVSAIELCGVHAKFGDPSTFEATIAPYRKAGIGIVSIGVEGLADKAADEEHRFEFLKAAGIRYMSIDFNLATTPKSFKTAEALAEKYDVRLGIHNHGGRHWLGCAAMLQHVFNQTGERIGLCLDTGWAIDSGEDPVKMIQTFAKRLHGLHIKDFTFDRAGRVQDVVSGTGNLNLAEVGKALDAARFKGYMTIEYEGDVKNPVPAVRQCVANVRAAIPDAK